MANLECNLVLTLLPWILCDEIKILQMESITILLCTIITMRHINNVLLYIFLNHEPRATTQAKTFALSDSVEPKPLMFAKNLSRLQFYNGTFLLTQEKSL